ncbi:MAG: hypothetical protein KME52_19035 [Desmonostoc geniculatum HA4340-LM1]|nr:hypothetical protein [Desmonostoc geniculatum HA4340-LM1]
MGHGAWGMGVGGAGGAGEAGEEELLIIGSCPMPNAQCPMPNPQIYRFFVC